MARSTTDQLDDLQRQYRELARQVADIGFIAAGTITHRHTRCGKPGCGCQADPPRLHGPYYQWTRKINGKTVTRRLTEHQARRYQEWITNDRRLRALIAQMRQIAAQGAELLTNDPAEPT
jgi:hypothetical protein